MSIAREELRIGGIPALVLGEPSDQVYLYVHGQNGNKEEAFGVAESLRRYGYQTLSLDLPGHGERADKMPFFDPWHVAPELAAVMRFAETRWKGVSLFANSIGAWFGMLGLRGKRLDRCLFVSPVLDMKRLLQKMMGWADVSEERLRRERLIPTDFGQTLSWEYWEYVASHPITAWESPTEILYGGSDALIDRDTVEQFAQRFRCGLTVMENGEHWFHTREQMDFLHRWLERSAADNGAQTG